ncbi:hypothetical protein N7495_001367 [Penicillium taxi]|uniref:uncharacterized protein n=1 Tax=Penicillium taxi TaxID=168475 RepID=UPI002544FA92|nr:uncharacterized protein N7495_001367 [Penicillium taxi]KAJ5908685.1 hypothetical protein N7495_001367 [Penicillium taxi]
MRQQGDATFLFRQALDHALFSTRAQPMLTEEEVHWFDTAIRIFATHDEVNKFNIQRLQELRSPVIRIDAISIGGQAAKTASSDDAGNLLETLSISIGSRVMLTKNLWTAYGLVNGAFGTVTDIVWPASTTDPRLTQPLALLIDFDTYSGPGLTYVAISRVRSLEGVMFKESFDFERFKLKHSITLEMRLADVYRRRSQHLGRVQTPPVAHAWPTSQGSPGALIRSLQQQRSQRFQDEGMKYEEIEPDLEPMDTDSG